MARSFARASLLAAIASLLASCGGHAVSPQAVFGFRSPSVGALTHDGCYVTKIAPQTVQATVTFYGYPDNYPPSKQIAHPVIHRFAAGAGTYCNPTTFATEPTSSENSTIPYGIKIYVPAVKHYFIREDDCTTSGSSSGSGSNGCYGLWFDVWIGGNKHSNFKAVIACEQKLTPSGQVDVVLWPSSNEPVAHPGPLYRNAPAPNGTCDGLPGSSG